MGTTLPHTIKHGATGSYFVIVLNTSYIVDLHGPKIGKARPLKISQDICPGTTQCLYMIYILAKLRIDLPS